MSHLTKRLRSLRLQNGLSSEDLSLLLCVSRQAYCNYENGTRQIPHDSLALLADYYDVSLDYLYGRTDKDITASSPENGERAFLCLLHTLDPSMKLLLLQIMEYLSHIIRTD